MLHRHLKNPGFSLAAIDDLIARGSRADWNDLRDEMINDPELLEMTKQVCKARIGDPYAQRYHFWMHYVASRTA